MANVIGTVVKIGINVPVEKKDGGSYQGWKLVYEDEKGEVKTIAKHMNSLKYAAALKNGLENLKVGDAFVLEQEKEGDFWNPKNIYKSDATTPTQKTNSASPRSTTAASSNSTYATKEERAQTQVYIVRQSSVTSALKLLEVTGNKKATPDDVIRLAKEFEAFVMGKEVVKEKQNQENPFEDLDDDIPY